MVDAMAANSGGVEWASIIKPIVSPYTYSSVNKYDLLELCSAINKRYINIRLNITTFNSYLDSKPSWRITYLIFFFFSGSEILHHKDSFKVFYNSFAILTADYINLNASTCKFFLLCGLGQVSPVQFCYFSVS